MTDEQENENRGEEHHSEDREGDEDAERDKFGVVIDRIEYEVATATPTAGDLMKMAGTESDELDQYQLIALDGPSDEGGQRVTVFHPDDEIDLREPNRDHFRNVPKGNPRS